MFVQQAGCCLYTPRGFLVDIESPHCTRFERNSWGHIVVHLNLARQDAPQKGESLRRLVRSGIKVGESAVGIFLGREYEAQSFGDDEIHTIVVVPNVHIEDEQRRTLRTMRKEAKRLGYRPAFAGMAPGLARTLTADDFSEMRIGYINIPHVPIRDVEDCPSILSVNRNGGIWINSCPYYPDEILDRDGACAFLY